MRTRRALDRCFALAPLAAAFAACPALAQDAAEAPPPYKSERGPYPPLHVPALELHDGPDGTTVVLNIVYPDESGGALPVVLLSHGLGGSGRRLDPLAEHWASHGYAVIKITHRDSPDTLALDFELSPSDETDRASALRAALAKAARDPDYRRGLRERRSLANWQHRPLDAAFVLSNFNSIYRFYPLLAGRLDETRVAVAGHSFGAHTAMLLAGVRPVVDGEPTDRFAHPAVDAAILLSPQGPDEALDLTEESFAEFATPALFVTGDNDARSGREDEPKDAEWRTTGYRLSPAGDKYLAWIDGAYHNLGGISGAVERAGRDLNGEIDRALDSENDPEAAPDADDDRRGRLRDRVRDRLRERPDDQPGAGRADRGPVMGPPNPAHVALVNSAALAFLDAYLKGDAEAELWLRSGGFAAQAQDASRIEHR